MIGGTLARLAGSVDEPLEAATADGDLPALALDEMQSTLDGDRTVQAGTAAERVSEDAPSVTIDVAGDEVHLTESSSPVVHDFATGWVADVTDTGLFVPESVRGDGPMAFPFDLIRRQTGTPVEVLGIEVLELFRSWQRAGVLADTWMVGEDDVDGTSITYHDDTDDAMDPTIGVGFEREWSGSYVEGVIYRSGYVALYDVDSAVGFVTFVESEVLPYAFVQDDDGSRQSALGDSDEDAAADTEEGGESA